jgi:hypothetical protein
MPVGAGDPAGLPQRPVAERPDEAGLLRDRQEGAGQQHAPLRVAPAQQRLEGAHRAALDADDRLVFEEEFAGRKPPGDIPGTRRAGGILRRERRIEEAHAARRALGGVKRDIGPLDELGHRGVARLQEGDADAAAARNARLPQLERFGKERADGAAGILHLARRRRARDRHHEFIAAEAVDLARRAQRLREARGERRQKLVAGIVPEAVVDGLEAVEIEKQQRRAAFGGARPQEIADIPLQAEAVGKPGQPVVVKPPHQPLLALAPSAQFGEKERPLPSQPVEAHAEDRRERKRRRGGGGKTEGVCPGIGAENVMGGKAGGGQEGSEDRSRERRMPAGPRQRGFQHHVTLNRCYHDNRVLRPPRPEGVLADKG